MLVELNCQEKRTLRKVISIQLESLRGILNEDCEEDITLFCIHGEVDKFKMKRLVLKNVEAFEKVYDEPERLLELNEMNLSMIKHILTTQINRKKSKRRIWRKLLIFEQLNFNPN